MRQHLKEWIKRNLLLIFGAWRLKTWLLTENELLGLSFANEGYLLEEGWFVAKTKMTPLDHQSSPIPWMTYPMIELLKQRLGPQMKVFEYGSGSSTLFLAKLTSHVTSVEGKRKWYDLLIGKAPANVKSIFHEDKETFPQVIDQQESLYDVIVIDGPNRFNCGITALRHLHPSGVMIVDDTEREQERRLIDHLISNGYKSLDFWGLAPGLVYKKCTTIIYRSQNCFQI